MRFDSPVLLLVLTAVSVHAVELNTWMVVSGSINSAAGVALPHASVQLCPMTRDPLHIASNPSGCLTANSSYPRSYFSFNVPNRGSNQYLLLINPPLGMAFATLCHSFLVDSISPPAMKHLRSLELHDISILDDSNLILKRTKSQYTLNDERIHPECACELWTPNSEVEVSMNDCVTVREVSSEHQNSLEFRKVVYHYIAPSSLTSVMIFAISLAVNVYSCAMNLVRERDHFTTPAIAAFVTAAACTARIVYHANRKGSSAGRHLCSGNLWHIYEDGCVRCAPWAEPVVGRLTLFNFFGRLNKDKHRSEQEAAQRAAIFASLDAEPNLRAVILTPSPE